MLVVYSTMCLWCSGGTLPLPNEGREAAAVQPADRYSPNGHATSERDAWWDQTSWDAITLWGQQATAPAAAPQPLAAAAVPEPTHAAVEPLPAAVPAPAEVPPPDEEPPAPEWPRRAARARRDVETLLDLWSEPEPSELGDVRRVGATETFAFSVPGGGVQLRPSRAVRHAKPEKRARGGKHAARRRSAA